LKDDFKPVKTPEVPGGIAYEIPGDHPIPLKAKPPGFFSRLGGKIAGGFRWFGRALNIIHIASELAYPGDYPGGHHGRVGGGGPDDVAQQLKKDLYAFGNAGGIFVKSRDIDVDDQGRINAQSPPLPQGQSTFENTSQAPGLTGAVWRLAAGTWLPWGLNEVADGRDVVPGSPHPEGHHTIYPTRGMPFDEFSNLVHNLPWERIPGRVK